MASTRPIDMAENPASSTATLEQSYRVVSRSPSKPLIIDDHIKVLDPPPPPPRNVDLGLPHKWRPMSDYELCDTEKLKKHGIVKPDATSNSFNVYIKKKDRNSSNPAFYFIKSNTPGSYLSEFEAFNAALHNLFEDGIIPTAHVIYDDSKPDNPPIAVCTRFDKSFITAKKQPITPVLIKKPEVVRCLAIIIALAQLLEECDLHGNNFVWSDSAHLLMRVDPGQTLWNFLIQNPKTSPELKSWLWGSAEDIFPLTVDEFKNAPNFKSASPRYCPGGSGKKSIFSDGSSYMTWWSKNAFTPVQLEVYREPKNLQDNPEFNYIKFKLATKFALLGSETSLKTAPATLGATQPNIIEELARLYLRATEGPKDKPVKLTHIEDVAKHLNERMQQCKTTLTKSPEYKEFAKKYFALAMNEIHDERDAFNKKINNKINKPKTKVGYLGLFNCMNPNNAQASLTEDALKSKGEALDREVMKLT